MASMESMASIIDISCDCGNNSHDNGLNIDPNCNFQFYNILKDSSGIEYYNLDNINYFYKGMDKSTILDYDDPNNSFKNKPSWMSDVTTALIYYNMHQTLGKQANIFAFKSIKTLKLFNLLSINNLTILYNTIMSDLIQTQTQLSMIGNQNNLILLNKLQKLFNYLKVIEIATGFNVTIDEQNELASSQSFYNKYTDSITGDIIKYRINNNLHSGEKIDLNRWSFFSHDAVLVDILILYFPHFDGYCGYRTKTLSHGNYSFHEEICIFNPELCIRRATAPENPLDASNSSNFVMIHAFLGNKTPSYKITTGEAMNLNGGLLDIDSIKSKDIVKYNSFKSKISEVTELTNNLKKLLCKDSNSTCPDINKIYQILCVDLIKYKLDKNENNNHMYHENDYKFDINNIFNHLRINKIFKLYKLFLEEKEEKDEKEVKDENEEKETEGKKIIIFNLLNKYIKKIINKSTIKVK